MKTASSEDTMRAMVTLTVMGNIPEGRDDYNGSETSCSTCKHVRSIPGNYHVLCSKPDETMTGKRHGIQNGWFMYPFCFDPIWRTSECKTYEEQIE